MASLNIYVPRYPAVIVSNTINRFRNQMLVAKKTIELLRFLFKMFIVVNSYFSEGLLLYKLFS